MTRRLIDDTPRSLDQWLAAYQSVADEQNGLDHDIMSWTLRDRESRYDAYAQHLSRLFNYEQSISPQGIRYHAIDVDVEYADAMQWPNLAKLISNLEQLENSRRTVMIRSRFYRPARLINGVMTESESGVREFTPGDFQRVIEQYGEEDTTQEMLSIRVSEVPVRGACDSKLHHSTVAFASDETSKVTTLKISSVKTKDNNCLIGAISQCNAALGKGFRAANIRAKLALPAGAIDASQAPRIAAEIGCSVKVWRILDDTLSVVAQSAAVLENHANVMILDDHYWVIRSSMVSIEASRFTKSMQLQMLMDDAPQCTDEVISSLSEDVRISQVLFTEIVENPSLEVFQSIVDSGKHVVLSGAAGCGKTWLLKNINQSSVTMTATTAAAADLLEGRTIQSVMHKKERHQTVVVDEVSMLGSMAFENLREWAEKGKIQLILSGDALQLPPIGDRFFFKSSEFYKFAQGAVLVKLTEIKRQKDVA